MRAGVHSDPDRARRRGREPQAGVTLIEILVVLAILVVLMLSAVGQMRKVRQSDLREDGARLAAALRYSYDRATATGEHHRVVIDLDEEGFAVERCEGKVRLKHGIEEHQLAEEEELLEQAKQFAVTDDQGNFNGLPEAGALPMMGGAMCAPVKGAHGKPQLFRKKRGIGIKQVYVAHVDDVVTEGKIAINFFPLGTAERAVVEVSDIDDNVFSIIVHPLTGRVQFKSGAYPRPEDFITRDAEGKEVADE